MNHHHNAHVLLCYKNFSKDCNVSHIGLGVTAAYTAKTLIQHGYNAQAFPAIDAKEIGEFIKEQEHTDCPVTHVQIMAQWIPTMDLARLARKFPRKTFSITCHSNIAFLQAEPNAIRLVREAIDLETGLPNFHMAANNIRLARALERMYGRPITYLPNLYWTHGKEPIHRPSWNGGLLKIGCFGSLRIYKNFSTAIAASIELTNQLKCESEIWINCGRSDGFGNVVHKTALAWTKDLPNITLKEFNWASWPEFKRKIGTMNILAQPSFTETFNNVTADGVCEGVPSVVGNCIEWVPNSWKADPDDSSEVANVARRLLTDHHAPSEGFHALKKYVKEGLPHWAEFLNRKV